MHSHIDCENPFNFANAWAATQFFLRLPLHLLHPVRPPETRAYVQRLRDRREDLFLEKLRTEVLGSEDGERPSLASKNASPYREMFRWAGCEFGDLQRLVTQEGLEAALGKLVAEGIYLTVDEFKGRQPIRRGSLSLASGPHKFRNPRTVAHIPLATGGSRSQGTPVAMDLRFVRGCTCLVALYLEACGGLGWRKAVWEVPGAGARFRLAKYGGLAEGASAWFSQVDPWAKDLHPVFAWNTRLMRWSGMLVGRPVPAPVHAPLTDPRPVLGWIEKTLREGRTPFVFTFPSSAAALCREAGPKGRSLEGARFMLGGEPITEARIRALQRLGAVGLARYGSIECGPIGYGCLNRTHPDEVHILGEHHAVILAGEYGAPPPGMKADGILITELHPYSPFTLINASMGDYAVLIRDGASCGCPVEGLGWRARLHTIRSSEKLTGGGMTFATDDVVRILEEVLPQKLGGGLGDYQLVEEEGEDGTARILLVVSPRVGAVEEKQAIEAFLEALGRGSIACQMMSRMWKEAGLVRVERREPASTRSGKVLHLHVSRRPGSGP